MAWCRPSDKLLSEPMMVSLLTHIWVTRPLMSLGKSRWSKVCYREMLSSLLEGACNVGFWGADIQVPWNTSWDLCRTPCHDATQAKAGLSGTWHEAVGHIGRYLFQMVKTTDRYSDVIMGTMASKSPALRIFAQPFIQTQIKENIKAPRHWLLCEEFTCDRWIPRTKGQ